MTDETDIPLLSEDREHEFEAEGHVIRVPGKRNRVQFRGVCTLRDVPGKRFSYRGIAKVTMLQHQDVEAPVELAQDIEGGSEDEANVESKDEDTSMKTAQSVSESFQMTQEMTQRISDAIDRGHVVVNRGGVVQLNGDEYGSGHSSMVSPIRGLENDDGEDHPNENTSIPFDDNEDGSDHPSMFSSIRRLEDDDELDHPEQATAIPLDVIRRDLTSTPIRQGLDLDQDEERERREVEVARNLHQLFEESTPRGKEMEGSESQEEGEEQRLADQEESKQLHTARSIIRFEIEEAFLPLDPTESANTDEMLSTEEEGESMMDWDEDDQTFPMQMAQHHLKKPFRVGKESMVFAVGAVEYLTKYLLKKAKKSAKTKGRIAPADIAAAIKKDEELSKLLSNVIIPKNALFAPEEP